ncbi:MAG: hypothetical protein AB7F86_18945 [Bdellovibrionales bacterium]
MLKGMDRSQLQKILLKMSVLAIALLSWASLSYLLNTRPQEKLAVESPLLTLVRLPASLPTQFPVQMVFAPSVRAVATKDMEIISLRCWDHGDLKVRATSAKWVRVTGRPCQNESSLDEIQVTNLTNGYTGTVFSASTEQLTTDFLPLENGHNNILIRLAHAGGITLENQFLFIKE